MSEQPMLSSTTLHQLTLRPSAWGDYLPRIQQVWQNGDLLLLLAEAAHGYEDIRLQYFSDVALLTTDAEILGITLDHTSSLVIMGTDDWAKAILTHQRCITWR